MGDAGSNLLGLLLACVAIQGVLKTAAVVALFFPLLILAVPALDATFVVAKRIKYGRPVYSADRWHFHHRFANIGFSQRRTVLYLYGWTLSLAALALAMRFVPYSDDDGTLHVGWTLVIVAFALIAVAASVYLVIVLEILKFRRFRERELRRQVETGEIAALSASEIERRDRARGGDRRVQGGAAGRRRWRAPAAPARDGRVRGRHPPGLTCSSAAAPSTASGRGRSRSPSAAGTGRAPAPAGASGPWSGSWRSTRSSRSTAPTITAGGRRAAPATRRSTSCSPSWTRAATPRSGASSCTGRARTRAARCASGPTSAAAELDELRGAAGAPRRAPAATDPGRAQTLELIAGQPELRAEDLAGLGRPREAPLQARRAQAQGARPDGEPAGRLPAVAARAGGAGRAGRWPTDMKGVQHAAVRLAAQNSDALLRRRGRHLRPRRPNRRRRPGRAAARSPAGRRAPAATGARARPCGA